MVIRVSSEVCLFEERFILSRSLRLATTGATNLGRRFSRQKHVNVPDVSLRYKSTELSVLDLRSHVAPLFLDGGELTNTMNGVAGDLATRSEPSALNQGTCRTG